MTRDALVTPPPAPLSARELVVLRWLAQGARLVPRDDSPKYQVETDDGKFSPGGAQHRLVHRMFHAGRIAFRGDIGAAGAYVITELGLHAVEQAKRGGRTT